MQIKRRLFWQIFPSYLLITLVSLFAVSWFASASLKRFFFEKSRSDLEARAGLMTDRIAPFLFPLNTAQGIDEACKKTQARFNTHFTVMLPCGSVIGDSQENPADISPQTYQSEVIDALAAGTGSSIRFNSKTDKDEMYVAVTLKNTQGEVAAIIRASVPVYAVEEAVRRVRLKIVLAGALIAILAVSISLVVSRRIIRPIQELKEGSRHFALGKLNRKLRVTDSEEMGELADAMNQMASQLNDRIKTEINQRNKLEAILSSMVEGVVAVDMEERILSINPAAARIFRTQTLDLEGRGLQEMIRSLKLQQFVKKAINSAESVEGDIPLYQFDHQILHTQSVALRDANNQRMGTLFILNDVTRLRQLENMRRDFAANASHEIKTPITSIKGFVETLLNQEDASPEEIRRFLNIIMKNVDRLINTIEDLLDLARIERMDERSELVLKEGRIHQVLEGAILMCQTACSAKNIRIDFQCDKGITAPIDLHLLERAAVNLLDNAIKYSNRDSVVEIRAEVKDDDIEIRFRDHGIGIGREHLPRLFERFYRVDEARSRKVGGTGLGLAIVKHIAQMHSGRITVESTPGVGSTFYIRIPRKTKAVGSTGN